MKCQHVSLQVSGPETAWRYMLTYLYPIPSSSRATLTPGLVLQVLPVAHFFNFQPALVDCTAAAASFQYEFYNGLPGKADPLLFLCLAEKLQILGLAVKPMRHISNLIRLSAEEGLTRCHHDQINGYLSTYSIDVFKNFYGKELKFDGLRQIAPVPATNASFELSNLRQSKARLSELGPLMQAVVRAMLE
eukprot:693089-Pelagomonas_calceolata.AAC.1